MHGVAFQDCSTGLHSLFRSGPSQRGEGLSSPPKGAAMRDPQDTAKREGCFVSLLTCTWAFALFDSTHIPGTTTLG